MRMSARRVRNGIHGDTGHPERLSVRWALILITGLTTGITLGLVSDPLSGVLAATAVATLLHTVLK